MKNRLSVVILTHNNESQIVKAISSIKDIAFEIIVIDDNSTDRTVTIAKKNKAKVFTRKLDNFSAQRNYGTKKSQGEWVLFLDSDEIISKPLALEIKKRIKTTKKNGFYIRRIDIFLNKKIRYGEAGNVWLLRLVQKNKGIWKREVHEFWDSVGPTEKLVHPMFHYSHSSIEDFFNSINYFSTLHVNANEREGKSSNILKIFLWPIGKFIYYYFLKLGFIDGRAGLIYALMMSTHSLLSWTKLWIKQK